MSKEGKILKIIDTYNVVVSLGSGDGVKENTLFQVYSIGTEIIDNDGESYGTLDIIKATLKPVAIYQKMTLCTNNEFIKKTLKKPNPASSLARIMDMPNMNPYIFEEVEQVVPLVVHEADYSVNFKEKKIIYVNDPVKILQSNSFDKSNFDNNFTDEFIEV